MVNIPSITNMGFLWIINYLHLDFCWVNVTGKYFKSSYGSDWVKWKIPGIHVLKARTTISFSCSCEAHEDNAGS